MSERLEVFRADGTAAGCGVERNEAHEKGILHGASHVFICRRDADGLKVLLQRRSADKDSYPGCLDTSSAGHIARGSDFLETALREMEEELGIRAQAEELTELFMQRVNLVSEFYGKPFIDCEVNRVYLYVPPAELTLRLQEEEVSEVLWMNMEEVLRRVQAGDEEYCLERAEFERVVQRVGEILK